MRAGGGKAACWRVAGSIAGAAGTVFLAAAFAAGAFLSAVLAVVLGTTLRAIGRGFGKGTFFLAAASAVHADDPRASARIVAKAVARKAATRAVGVTAFLRGESFKRWSLRSI